MMRTQITLTRMMATKRGMMTMKMRIMVMKTIRRVAVLLPEDILRGTLVRENKTGWK